MSDLYTVTMNTKQIEEACERFVIELAGRKDVSAKAIIQGSIDGTAPSATVRVFQKRIRKPKEAPSA